MKITWPTVAFDEAATDETGGHTKLQRSEYQASGLLPIIDQGQSLIAGYTDNPLAMYDGPLPVVLFGDHTRSLKHFDRPFVLGADGVKVLAPKEGFNSKFLYYFWLHKPVANLGYSRHFKLLRELDIPRPHPREQARIIGLLDQANALRRQRAEADAKLTRLLPALFRHHFGDLQRNDRKFELRPFDFIVRDTKNGLYKPAEFFGRGTRILKMFNLQDGSWDLSRVDLVDLDDDERSSYGLDAGDILLNRVNSPELVGKCAVVTDELAGAVFESKNIRIRVNPGVATPEFLWFYLGSDSGRSSLTQGMKHAIGMATINGADLRGMRIPLPSLEDQRRWSAACKSVQKLQGSAALSAAMLETLFQTLLHRAFTGELTAKWREAHLREGLQEMTRLSRA